MIIVDDDLRFKEEEVEARRPCVRVGRCWPVRTTSTLTTFRATLLNSHTCHWYQHIITGVWMTNWVIQTLALTFPPRGISTFIIRIYREVLDTVHQQLFYFVSHGKVLAQ